MFKADASDFERFEEKYELPLNADQTEFETPTVHEIWTSICQLNNQKSTGTFLPAPFFKYSTLAKNILTDATELVFKNTTIKNSQLDQQNFDWLPDDLFKNTLVSIPKVGQTCIENSRPLALKRPFCKVVHGLIRDYIYKFVFDKLESSVTGFVPGRGTRDAIFIVRQTISFAIQSVR